MTKERFILMAGSQANLARLLGVSRAAVCKWKNVPQGRIFQLMVLRPEWFDIIKPN